MTFNTLRHSMTMLCALLLLLLVACTEHSGGSAPDKAPARASALAEPGQAIPTLNMSRDLVRLGIAAQNLSPDMPSLDATPLFQAALDFAARNRVSVMTVDPGSYYLLSATSVAATLSLYQLSNMSVDLAGSKLVFKGPLLPIGLHIAECSNFTLTNFSIDYLNPPYTHVRIAAVDPKQRKIHYELLPGWPDPASFNGLAEPFGGSIGAWGVVFRGDAVVHGTSRTRLGYPFSQGVIDITDEAPWTQADTLSTLRPGDTFVVTIRGGGQPVFLNISNGVTLSKIDIHGSSTWAVNVNSSSNVTIDGLRVLPRPGVGLIGSNGDGIHFAWSLENNHIRNSFVSRTMDDAMVMDSPHVALLVAQDSPRQLRMDRRAMRFPNGTEVNFVDPSTAREIPGGVIVAQEPPDTKIPAAGPVTLSFDRDLPRLPASAGMVYASPTSRGKGSSIVNNVVEDTYGGRGIWLNGIQGVSVQGNTLRRTSQGGIVLQQSTDSLDIGSFGPPSRDVQISANTLDSILGPATNGTGSHGSLASIQVISTTNGYSGFAAPAEAVNSGISIVNNIITNSGRSGIWMGQVAGGLIQGNRVDGAGFHTELPIWGIGQPFADQVAMDALSRVVIRYSVGIVTDFDPADCLFDWAERHYASLFPSGPSSLRNIPWYYRHYPGPNTYLGISSLDDSVYYLSGNTLSNAGAAATWFATSGCQ